MKLTAPEAKAVKFVLFLICLSLLARWLNRADPISVEQNLHSAATEVLNNGARRATAGPLDPNAATAQELEKLPGIGPASAKNIIAARPIRTVEDLANVIGRKRAERLLPKLTPLERVRPRSVSIQPDPATSNLHAAQRSARESTINLNRASSTELERLPGVGPALAQRIIAARDSLRSFRDWSQVDAVQGIGPALLKKLKTAASL